MSGYKDYLSNEMKGDMETPMKPKRTRLSQFRHGGYHSSMDEFFTAGKKSYGIRNVDVSQLGKYGSPGRGGNPRFSMAEFFGKNFLSNGGEVTTYNNPGNLEKGQGYAGETGKTYANDRERPFVVFDSPEMGVRALAMDLQTKIKRHEGDVDKIIAQYAPDNENDTKKYQEFVKQKLKKDKVTDKDLKFLVQAIIEKENKPEVASYYLENPDVITKGLAMSYFQLPSGTSFEQAVNEISAKEATLKKVLKNRKPFQYGGGADAGAGSGFGGGSSSSGGNTGGNKGNNKGDRRGVRSLRDSGMVQGSTGYGPAGAGGQALGPSGNQGGNQGNQQDTTEDTTTTLNSPSFSPTYDYNPPKKDSLLDDFVDTYRDLTTFNTPLGVLSIEPKGLTSVEATLSFKKGGLLDRSSKK